MKKYSAFLTLILLGILIVTPISADALIAPPEPLITTNINLSQESKDAGIVYGQKGTYNLQTEYEINANFTNRKPKTFVLKMDIFKTGTASNVYYNMANIGDINSYEITCSNNEIITVKNNGSKVEDNKINGFKILCIVDDSISRVIEGKEKMDYFQVDYIGLSVLQSGIYRFFSNVTEYETKQRKTANTVCKGKNTNDTCSYQQTVNDCGLGSCPPITIEGVCRPLETGMKCLQDNLVKPLNENLQKIIVANKGDILELTDQLTAFNTGCYADGECYASFKDGFKVTTNVGWNQEPTGQNYADENVIGKTFNIKAIKSTDTALTLIGNNSTYLKQQGAVYPKDACLGKTTGSVCSVDKKIPNSDNLATCMALIPACLFEYTGACTSEGICFPDQGVVEMPSPIIKPAAACKNKSYGDNCTYTKQVQCVNAPCNPIDVDGVCDKFTAQGGTSSLYCLKVKKEIEDPQPVGNSTGCGGKQVNDSCYELIYNPQVCTNALDRNCGARGKSVKKAGVCKQDNVTRQVFCDVGMVKSVLDR